MDTVIYKIESSISYQNFVFQYEGRMYEISIDKVRSTYLISYTINGKVSSGHIEKKINSVALIQDWRNSQSCEWVNSDIVIADTLFLRNDTIYGFSDNPIPLSNE